MTLLSCQCWTEADLYAARESWRNLSAQAGTDGLFLRWEWVSCWWRTHSAALGGGLRVYGVKDEHGELVGIAPFYLHRARHGRLIGTRRLQLVGSAWRAGTAAFSEYLDLLALPARRADVVARVAAELVGDGAWDELVMANIRRDSAGEILGEALRAHSYLRTTDDLQAWALDIPATFEQFLEGLDSNTRRRLFNQRQKLPGAEYVLQHASEWPASLDALDAFLAHRWGGAQAAIIRSFHERLIATLPQAQVRISSLWSAGKRISVMLNLRANDTEYYLQSGFDASAARGVSPGYLHLGHAIEAACRDGVRRFDLLAGRGLNRDYKRDLASVVTPLRTLHLVRRQPLRSLFRAADLLRGRTAVTSRSERAHRAGDAGAESFTLAG